VADSVKTEVLQLAARAAGGPRKLRDYLRVPSADIVSWLNGGEEPPAPVFLRALELLLDDLDHQDSHGGEARRVERKRGEILKIPPRSP
jgi:hypothetical protein